ncbi:bifunctional riboflavin kinase/FAD synthetase [Helicobacter jaachi]|uniref:Riboflavin biosynthesis protein n=1 Tax=Helicobacter jaachi TaxID=1677920 RepID=A0A4U8TAT8_9HELI|nr:bifunctional riboflavin kinase/FAD synthetase [Helicobacter jaachi]TLD96981.1 bifunctional riboflavin kinase/FAD synthetase [Helicobacter jaachi]
MRNFLSIHSDEHILGLALGKFDGMHLAHKELFKHLNKHCALLCIESQGLSLTPNKAPYSPCEIISVHFEDIAKWSGQQFIATLTQKFPNLQKLIVGYDFCFGKDRAFSASDLPHLFHGEIIIVPQFCMQGVGVHSSVIRELIRYGDMELANAMLGRYYHIQGEIIKGQNLGARQLYATINLQSQNYILPQDGVYASFTELEGEIMPSVCFIGHRFSTDRCFSIESHILDRNLTCRANNAKLYFVRKIRDNQSFSDLTLLKNRISKDIATAKDILHNAKQSCIV